MSDPLDADDSREAMDLRREVRRRLHVVDDLTPPPAPDFARQAIAAARAAEVAPAATVPDRRPHRRRSLLVAAAAVAAVAVAVPTLSQLLRSSSSGSANSTAVSVERDAAGPAQVDPGAPFLRGLASGSPGSSSDLTREVDALRVRLTAPPYDATSVVLRPDPTRVEVTLPRPDRATLALAQGMLPAGTPVVLLPSG